LAEAVVAEFLKLKGYPKLNDIQDQAVKSGILGGKGNFLVFALLALGKRLSQSSPKAKNRKSFEELFSFNKF
jgi:hypothetical protein